MTLTKAAMAFIRSVQHDDSNEVQYARFDDMLFAARQFAAPPSSVIDAAAWWCVKAMDDEQFSAGNDSDDMFAIVSDRRQDRYNILVAAVDSSE